MRPPHINGVAVARWWSRRVYERERGAEKGAVCLPLPSRNFITLNRLPGVRGARTSLWISKSLSEGGA